MPDGHLLPHRSSTPHDDRVTVRRPAWGCGPAPLRAAGALRDAAGRARRRVAHAGERRRTDPGVVTAEFAMALPAVVIVLAAVLATATVALDQMRCTDAARAAARAAARNEPAATVAAVARAEGPPGAEVQVSRVGDRVVVTVSAGVKVRLLGTQTIRVSSRAVAVREPAGQLMPALLPVAWRRRRRDPSGTGSRVHRRPALDGPHEALRHIGSARVGRRRAAWGERRADDAGAGTVLVVGLVAVGVVLALAVSLLGQVVAARHRAAAAADLAALAAAQAAHAAPVATTSANPCDDARRIARDNDAVLTSCGLDGRGVATVSVRADVKSGADVFHATAQARAGPAAIAKSDLLQQKVIHVTH